MINFIMSNYMIILIIVMIIVFSLIGSYVDKIDFFNSYKDDEEEENFEEMLERMKQKEAEEDEANKEIAFDLPDTIAPQEEVIEPDPESDLDNALFAPLEKDSEYEKLNRELNRMLSKKELINDDLLSDIEHLSLDKTQRYNFGDIPDLDDVDLPEIKKEEEPEDIWKF